LAIFETLFRKQITKERKKHCKI